MASAAAFAQASNCDSPVPAASSEGENWAQCFAEHVPAEGVCNAMSEATQLWCDEIEEYQPGVKGSADEFTQVVWAATTEMGCGYAYCTMDLNELEFPVTHVVCRYHPAGNVAGQYLENVNETVSCSKDTCTEFVSAYGDPHMVGFRHQRFDFTGEDGQWYALLHDRVLGVDMNIRITQPVSGVPQVTYITGLGLSVLGTDSEIHTIEIVINDPHNLEPGCPEDSSRPCLANGALTILVDGKEAGVGELKLGCGVYLSALNLPGECRPFGHQKYWLDKEAKADVTGSRRLRAGSRVRTPFSPETWIKKDRYRTDPEACDDYLYKASIEDTLFEHHSEHASLQITAPSVSLRVDIGKASQMATRDPTDSFDIPDHVGYRASLGFESINDISLNAQGILGETIQLRHDADGNAIMSGPDCIRGEEHMYKVTGPLVKGFTLDI